MKQANTHPNIVKIYDFYENNVKGAKLILEYLPFATLSKLISDKKLNGFFNFFVCFLLH